MDNLTRNRLHYERLYLELNAEGLAEEASTPGLLERLTSVNTSWNALYRGGFRSSLTGRTVVEVGSGDGLNALLMALAGARVYAVEIAEPAAAALAAAARLLSLPVTALCGDFRTLQLPPADFVVGKMALHHLTHEEEAAVLARVAELLHPDGEARFAEPAVNLVWLDRLRWAVPVPGRPSSLNRAAFEAWRESDPHPPREDSSAHYRAAAARYFEDVEIIPIGALERFRRLIFLDSLARTYGRLALAAEEALLPRWIHEPFARCQTLLFRRPRKASAIDASREARSTIEKHPLSDEALSRMGKAGRT